MSVCIFEDVEVLNMCIFEDFTFPKQTTIMCFDMMGLSWSRLRATGANTSSTTSFSEIQEVPKGPNKSKLA